MAFGLLVKDNAPVDYPFRRSGPAAEEAVRLGYVPGGPYYPRSMPKMRFASLRLPGTPMGFVPGGPYYPRSMPAMRYGYVPGGPYYPRSMPAMRYAGFSGSSTGCGDDGMSPCDDVPPGPQAQTQSESTGWSRLGVGAANLATSFINAFATNNNPASGGAGTYCPSGYYLSNGRCVPMPSGSSMTPLLVGGGLLAAFLLTRKRSA